MPLLGSAESILVGEINVENNLGLSVTDVEFGTPKVPTTPEEIQKANGHNALALVQTLPTAPAVGNTVVYYDRVAFSELFTEPDGVQPLIVPAKLASVYTLHDILGLINHYYGYQIRPSDVVNAAIDRQNWTVVMKATETSLGWLGQVTVQLKPGDALLADNFQTAELVPFTYPYFNTKVGQGAIYSYPWRFNDYASEFKAGTPTIERLASILKTVTGDGWVVYRSPVNYNLKEGVVSYNGPNLPTLPTNPIVDNVLVIDLSLYCLNFGGSLYLHYNDPH